MKIFKQNLAVGKPNSNMVVNAVVMVHICIIITESLKSD